MQAPNCHFSWVGMSAIWLCLAPFFPLCFFSLFLCSSTVSCLVPHVSLQQKGLADWMIEPRGGRGSNAAYSQETLGKSEILIALILLLCHFQMWHFFQSKCSFALEGNQIICTDWNVVANTSDSELSYDKYELITLRKMTEKKEIETHLMSCTQLLNYYSIVYYNCYRLVSPS